jgi:hypothetical protein
MADRNTKKFGNRPEGFEPSAVQLGIIRTGSATCIRVLGSNHFKYSPGVGRSQERP